MDVLEDLADGPVLEFAVGTGRIAAPLAARGVPVSGIELSRAMAARLASKPGGDAVEVTIGDMTTTRVAGQFSMVYLVYNTISNVTTQDGQVDVFRNAAAHLRPGGLFLVEVGLPDLRRLPPGQDTVPFAVVPGANGGGYVGFDQYDAVTQEFTSNHITVSPDGTGLFRRIPFRYAWPAEMDLMARIAGMRLKYRWAGWDRSPYTAATPGCPRTSSRRRRGNGCRGMTASLSAWTRRRSALSWSTKRVWLSKRPFRKPISTNIRTTANVIPAREPIRRARL